MICILYFLFSSSVLFFSVSIAHFIPSLSFPLISSPYPSTLIFSQLFCFLDLSFFSYSPSFPTSFFSLCSLPLICSRSSSTFIFFFFISLLLSSSYLLCSSLLLWPSLFEPLHFSLLFPPSNFYSSIPFKNKVFRFPYLFFFLSLSHFRSSCFLPLSPFLPLFSSHFLLSTFFSSLSHPSLFFSPLLVNSFPSVLCYTVLYCTVLYCTVLYCTVLYCSVFFSLIPSSHFIY